MTREEKLWTMRMQELVGVAEKLGIKINTKAAKSQAIEKILAAEEMNKKNEKELAKEEKEIKKIVEEPERLKEARKRRNQAETDALNATAKAVKKIEESSLFLCPDQKSLLILRKKYLSRSISAVPRSSIMANLRISAHGQKSLVFQQILFTQESIFLVGMLKRRSHIRDHSVYDNYFL